MFRNDINIRVRYAETDRMGFVYYGNYATYFEVARVEALRSLGFPYKRLEDSGILLPVINFNITYKQPGLYDDLLTIQTTIPKMPGVRLPFKYATYNEKGDLLNEAETTLVFTDAESKRPTKPPQDFLKIIEKYF